jgi:hypothetical protein
MPSYDNRAIRLPMMEAASATGKPPTRPGELISLAQETRLAADSIMEAAIHDRLIEIADELLDLARYREKSGHESR